MDLFQMNEVLRKLADQFWNRRTYFDGISDEVLTLTTTIAMLSLILRPTKVDCNPSSNNKVKRLSSLVTDLVRRHEVLAAVEKVRQMCFEFLRKTDKSLDHGWNCDVDHHCKYATG